MLATVQRQLEDIADGTDYNRSFPPRHLLEYELLGEPEELQCRLVKGEDKEIFVRINVFNEF